MRLRLSLLIAAVGFVAVGCGGSLDSLLGFNEYAGVYSGTWATVGVGDTGTVPTMTVQSTGPVSGTLYDTNTQQNGSFTGSMTVSGQFSGTYEYNNAAALHMSGQFLRTSNPTGLTGVLTETTSTGNVQVTFTLTQMSG